MKRNIKMKNRLRTPLRAAFFAGSLAAISMQASAADYLYSNIEEGGQIQASQTQTSNDIIEDSISGSWGILLSTLPFNFGLSGGPGLISVIGMVMEGLLKPLSDFLNEASIENGGYIEYLTYLPPHFDNNAFSISAFDAYNTNGKFDGYLRSTTDDVLFQVKVYAEFSANKPTTYKLKNLENIHIPVNGSVQNMVLEFYNADASQLIESLVLPAKANNKDFGITLAKTKGGSHVKYLKKDDRYHIKNTYTVDNLLNSQYEQPVYLRSEIESRLDALTDRAVADMYEFFLWQRSKDSSKAEISSHPEFYNGNVYSSDYILSQWQDPRWLIRANSVYHYGEIYYSDFTNNATVTEDRGLMLGESGQANYQLYIPKTGTYSLSFRFTNSEEQQVTVFNPLTDELVYSVTLPASSDGQPQSSNTRSVELEWDEGLLFLELNADNVEVDAIHYTYLRNDVEDSQAYLEVRHEFIRLEVANAMHYLDIANAEPLEKDAIEYGLAQVNFLLDYSIIPKMQDLSLLGYDPADPLMMDIANMVTELEAYREVTKTKLEFVRTGMVVVEAIDYNSSSDPDSSLAIQDDYLIYLIQGGASAAYDVYIPQAGNYQLSYEVANAAQVAGQFWIIIRNNDNHYSTFEFISVEPSQGEFSMYTGFTVYLEEGEHNLTMVGEKDNYLKSMEVNNLD